MSLFSIQNLIQFLERFHAFAVMISKLWFELKKSPQQQKSKEKTVTMEMGNIITLWLHTAQYVCNMIVYRVSCLKFIVLTKLVNPLKYVWNSN